MKKFVSKILCVLMIAGSFTWTSSALAEGLVDEELFNSMLGTPDESEWVTGAALPHLPDFEKAIGSRAWFEYCFTVVFNDDGKVRRARYVSDYIGCMDVYGLVFSPLMDDKLSTKASRDFAQSWRRVARLNREYGGIFHLLVEEGHIYPCRLDAVGYDVSVNNPGLVHCHYKDANGTLTVRANQW